MRISDWSSDVCSSDLARRGNDDPRPAAGCHAKFGLDFCQREAQAVRDGDLRILLPTLGIAVRILQRVALAVVPTEGLRSTPADEQFRSEERRVGKACVSTCRSR